MTADQPAFRGILSQKDGKTFILAEDGKRHLIEARIWNGYISHWLGQKVCARFLPQKDYETNAPIVIVWPDNPSAAIPFVELYYNERLVKYRASAFGHNAINVNEDIFNFSHLMNENEIMSKEEYFYRPALGEFAPSPNNGRFEILEDGKAYYDKFGRNFMRTIHVVRLEGIDTKILSKIFSDELEKIHNTPPDPRQPEKYKEFNFFTRSCTTIIRDGLNKYGFKTIKGIFPRDFFVSATYAFQREKSLKIRVFKMPQLQVPEAPPSAITPLLNIRNRFKAMQLNYEN